MARGGLMLAGVPLVIRSSIEESTEGDTKGPGGMGGICAGPRGICGRVAVCDCFAWPWALGTFAWPVGFFGRPGLRLGFLAVWLGPCGPRVARFFSSGSIRAIVTPLC
jgi:hypothetical protein